MMDIMANLVISLVNGLVTALNASWTAISPPGGLIESAMDWMLTLDNFVPVADMFVIMGSLALMCSFTVILKFGQKVIDWLPKK